MFNGIKFPRTIFCIGVFQLEQSPILRQKNVTFQNVFILVVERLVLQTYENAINKTEWIS